MLKYVSEHYKMIVINRWGNLVYLKGVLSSASIKSEGHSWTVRRWRSPLWEREVGVHGALTGDRSGTNPEFMGQD